MLKKAFLVLTILHLTLTCQPGCLRCSKQKKCLLCDTSKFYKLENSKCKKTQNENCQLINNFGKCKKCEKGFFLEKNTYKCVLAKKTIKNCEIYENEENCKKCEKKFFVENGKCRSVKREIAHCEFYRDFENCQECSKNAVLDHGGKNCVLTADKGNCAFFSFFRCNGCKKGFLKDENFIFERLMDFDNSENLEDFEHMVYLQNLKIKRIFEKNICRKKKIENCAKFENYQKCKKCDLNYYLTETNNCEEFPFESIQYCEIYKTRRICQKCENGYFLEFTNKCKTVEKIENCVIYNGKADSTICEECKSGFFIFEKKCKKREKSISIENCENQDRFADFCEKCKKGFFLVFGKLKCFKKIENCKISSFLGDSVVCEKCDDFFFLSENFCQKGNLENCRVFKNQGECEKCKDLFFLENGTHCVSQTKIENCLVYDPFRKDVCEKCNFFSEHFLEKTICEKSEKIQNCEIYQNSDTCQKCEKNFYLENKTCKIIPTNLNCLIYENKTCKKCINKFILKNKKCVKPLSITTDYCEIDNFSKNEESQNFPKTENSQKTEKTENSQNTENSQKTENSEKTENFENSKKMEETECLICKENTIGMNYENSYVCVENSFLENLLPFCKNYGIDKKCEICENGFFLRDGKCVENCDSVLFDEIEGNEKGFLLKKKNLCRNSENCEEIYVDLENPKIEYFCGKCKKSFLEVIDFETEKTIYKKKQIGDEKKILNPKDFFSSVECVENKDIVIKGILNENLRIVENCEFYYKLKDNIYGCLKCKNGYNGEIVEEVENFENGFIKKCEKDPTCEENHEFFGISKTTKNLLSCSKCTNPKEIPFHPISLNFSNSKTAKNLKKYSNLFSEGKSGKAFICIEPLEKIFSIPSENFNFPKNCGIGTINTFYKKNASESSKISGNFEKTTIFCSACKNGFFATYNIHNKNIITKCEKIENCDFSKTPTNAFFNNCEKCAENFGFEYDLEKGVLFEKCVFKDFDQNCFSFEISEGRKICRICKKGFFLNFDGKCEIFMAPKCKDTGFEFSRFFDFRDLSVVIFLGKNRSCTNCEINFSALKIEHSKFFCTPSDYISNKLYNHTSSIIKNCAFFKNGAKMICEKCKIGFVINSEKTRCFENNNLFLCEEAKSQNQCEKCGEGFISINFKCQKKNLLNCEKYLQNSSENSQKCEICQNGFFLENFACKKGEIISCQKYSENPQICEKCFQGYYLVNSENRSYCFPLPKNLNCEKFSRNFAENKLECEICKKGFFVKKVERENSKCLPFNQIFNCLEYEKNEKISESGFFCKKCSEDYFVKKNECFLRSYKNENVEVFEEFKDEAKICKKGFFLENGNCKKNPDGKEGCTRYSSKDICIGCKANFYLENNFCKKIENEIPNCLYYDSKMKCLKCESGFLIENDICVVAEVENCEIYENKKSCKTCRIGFGLKIEENSEDFELDNTDFSPEKSNFQKKKNPTKPKQSKSLQKSEIVPNPLKKAHLCHPIQKPNCLFYTKDYPWNCLLCQPHHNPDQSGFCVETKNRIKNCLFYESENECRFCEEKYFLTINRKNCVFATNLDLDENCANFEREEEPFCSICAFGFFFENGACKECVLQKGCATCDPFERERCLLCESGFFMDEGLCREVLVVEDLGGEGKGDGFLGFLRVFLFIFVFV